MNAPGSETTGKRFWVGGPWPSKVNHGFCLTKAFSILDRTGQSLDKHWTLCDLISNICTQLLESSHRFPIQTRA